ncbi:MAG: hypothetical protein IT260_18070 [Saprospiraceae bacterium]|nr:hypothetical protein [Saprospiraceae bacterium]
MSYPTQLKVFIAVLLLAVVGGRFGCYYFQKQYDTYRRPWAYSNDPAQALLVGHWSGTVTDPDGVQHLVEMDILEPLSDEERWQRVWRKRSKRDRSSPTFFDGFALLSTPGRRDSFELWGALDKPDGHALDFQMRPIRGFHPPGFNLNRLTGTWTKDTLALTVAFAWFRPDGSSHYNSADPRHNQDGRLLLLRSPK